MNGVHDSPLPLNDVNVVGNETSSNKPLNRNNENHNEMIDDSSPYYKDRQQAHAY